MLKVPSKIDAKQVDVCDTLPAHMVFASRAGRHDQQRPRLLAPRRRQGRARHTEFKITAKVDKDFPGGSLKNVVVATAGNAPKVSANATVDVAHVQGKVNKSARGGVTG